MIGYRYQYEYVSLEVYSQIHTSRQILLKQMCFVSVGSWYRCLIHLNFCTHYLFDDPNKMNNWDCIFYSRWGPYVNCSLLYWLYPGVRCSIGGIVWIKGSCTLTTRKTWFMRKKLSRIHENNLWKVLNFAAIMSHKIIVIILVANEGPKSPIYLF